MKGSKRLWKTARWTMCGTLSILLALQGVPTAALAEDVLSQDAPVITQEVVTNDAELPADPQATGDTTPAPQEVAPVADPAAATEDEVTVEVAATANESEDVEVPLDGAKEVPADPAKPADAAKPLAMDGNWANGDYGPDGTQATYTFTLDKASHVKVEVKSNTTANVEYELTNEAGDVQHAKGKLEKDKPAIDANLEAGTYKLVVRTDVAIPAAQMPEAFGIRATRGDVVTPKQEGADAVETAAEPKADEKAEEAKPEEAKPEETKPEETKPATEETKPEETKPAAEEKKAEEQKPAAADEEVKPQPLTSAIPSVIPKSSQTAKPQATAKKADTTSYDMSKSMMNGLGNNGLSTSSLAAPAVYLYGRRLVPGRDYVYSFQGNFQSSCRTITVRYIVRGVGRYYGTKVFYYRVTRAFSRLGVRAYGRVAYRRHTRRYNVWVSNPIRYWNAAGAVRYYKVGGSRRLSINARNGRILVRRGTARGTYRIRVCVQSAGTWNTMKGYRYVTCKVVVR